MKTCDQTGCDQEATVHLTKVVDGDVQKVHLCAACAEKTGIDLNQPESIPDLLEQFVGAGASPARTAGANCPRCGMDHARFKKRGRLGCANCYEAFGGELATVIQSMHHSGQHLGKVPRTEGKRSVTTKKIALLSEQLSTAVINEEYEDAARLRDQIKQLKEDLG